MQADPQYLRLCLQTLPEAFKPRAERQISEFFHDIFDHSLRNCMACSLPRSISSYITCDVNGRNPDARELPVRGLGAETLSLQERHTFRCPHDHGAGNLVVPRLSFAVDSDP